MHINGIASVCISVLVKSWSRGFSWAATRWQYWLGETLPVENNHWIIWISIMIQNVILVIIQSPLSLGRKMGVAKRKNPYLLQQVLVRLSEQGKRDSHRRITFNTSGVDFIDFFLFLTFVTDTWVNIGNCRNMETSPNQGTVESGIKQKYKWMIPECSWHEKIYPVLVVYVLKQAACLVIGIAVTWNLLTHLVLSRLERSTANRKQQPCTVFGFNGIW